MHLGDDRVSKTIGMGFIIVGIETRGKANIIHLMNVVHMPKLQANLLSVSKFLSNRLKIRFHVNKCIVRGVNGNIVVIA